MGLYAVLGLTLLYGTGLLDAMPSSYLDERQQALRNRAHRLAFVPVNYYILGMLLSLNLANHWFQEPFFIIMAPKCHCEEQSDEAIPRIRRNFPESGQ